VSRIAIVGMACRYPDATSTDELWDNVLAGRRAFRRLPEVRMPFADYWDPDPEAADKFYANTAAVLEGFEFDRLAYKVPGSTYRSTDLTHWLALDTAAGALGDAGFRMAEGLPRRRTGVVVGNSLTGEFTRANQMRLRWPYVRRTLAAALRDEGWADDRLSAFLGGLETRYKQPFPPVDEDSLAGALSNTIAGRICNYFDLGGGGYTVDGACSSSLLSVITAARALAGDELDVAIAGGVDLSIDPFEVIGFAKTGALATGEMRVYDRGSNGFWPGEGCGMVVLMRDDDARAGGLRRYATIAGWGISSDGKGSITRPELAGYQLALQRAYQRAGFGIDTVDLFEGHGTGTAVGDANELRALSQTRRAADPDAPAAALGTIKAIIGHTKAAAGVAGLIKATLAVHRQVLPPTVGCIDPDPQLTADDATLRVLSSAEAWPQRGPVRAGVSATGFGGINTHIAIESVTPGSAAALDGRSVAIASSRQDAELLLVDAASGTELATRLDEIAGFVAQASYAELADLAAALQRDLADRPHRAALVVRSPAAAETALRAAAQRIHAGADRVFDVGHGIFAGRAGPAARIGLLFPGQGSGRGSDGGALGRRFAAAADVFRQAGLPTSGDPVSTEIAQPRIAAGSLAGLRVLRSLGLEARLAVGHSLGELVALCWAAAIDGQALLRVARMRGDVMARHSNAGTMAGLGVAAEEAEQLLAGEPVVVAGFNGPQQTVVAGPVAAVHRVGARAVRAGLAWAPLPVSHAFHSPLAAPSADPFAERLRAEQFAPLARTVVSTVTGTVLDPGTDLVQHLHRQITAPVRFAQAVTRAAAEVDLFVEVGPGHVLTRMAREITDVPAIAMDTDSESLAGLLGVVGAAYVLGAPLATDVLFHGRLIRPLQVGRQWRFLASPCAAAPPVELPEVPARIETPAEVTPAGSPLADSPLAVLRRLVAERAELPVDAVSADSKPLDDLHLSSITVGQIVNQAARKLGFAGVQVPANFATASVHELADALTEIAGTGGSDNAGPAGVAGAAEWTRAFTVDLDAVPAPGRAAAEDDGPWQVHADPADPLAEPLRLALQSAAVGPGILVCLRDATDAEDLQPAVAAVRAAAERGTGRLLLVEQGRGAAALARTLRLEAPQVRTTIVHLAGGTDVATATERAVAETAATTGFTEVHFDADGMRTVPTLRVLAPAQAPGRPPIRAGDVLLVTGGGKGITAESALALAAGTGATLAIVGRSAPESDTELAANLARMRDSGLQVEYRRADVTDSSKVREVVAEFQSRLGPITVVLHGAGRNEPAALARLDLDLLRETLAPKVDGLATVLAAVDPHRLRLLITFGSVIGRFGLRGEAHYAVANDWLAERTTAYAQEHPETRCLCVEWSVWSGVGMGERLSVVESLLREGITPITPDRGIEILRDLLARPLQRQVVVVTGRAEQVDTIRLEQPELPLLRFLERPLLQYHGVELVAEARLSPDTDPYLDDHELDGNLLFPAVLALEAMAQVAIGARGRIGTPVFERVEFARPISVARTGGTGIRIAAVIGDDRATVSIRSDETGFAVDHFSATLSFTPQPLAAGPPDPIGAGLPQVVLDPAADLYGDILFQGKRFHRLLRYHRVAARHADADVAVREPANWFGSFLPGELLLGDPGMRDALLHGIQVCVPDATLLPIGVDRIQPGGADLDGQTAVRFTAAEREHDGDTYVYDLAVRTAAGTVVERWDGLRLRAIDAAGGTRSLAAPLLGPHLERGTSERLSADIAVVVEPDAGPRRANTALALSRALGRMVTPRYRPDGRPEIGGTFVSAAHARGLTIAVAAESTVACDLEPVLARPDWPLLLGQHLALADRVAAEHDEPPDTARTRVWCVLECLQKAGMSTGGPLTLRPGDAAAGWASFQASGLQVSTVLARARDVPEPLVFAILGKGR
jgi:enediyne polyketide synthase